MMDIIEHEERLMASGFNLDQAREILRVVSSGDAQAMSRADGQQLKSELKAEMKDLRTELKALDTKIGALDTKIDTLGHKLVATAWTVGGVAVGILIAVDFLK